MNDKECRICFENEPDDFINPCLCDGTSKWIHRDCLNEWRETNRDGKAYTNCMECNYEYLYKLKYQKEKKLYKHNLINKYKISYLFFIYLASLPLTFIYEILDEKNTLTQLLCFNNTYCINNSNNYYKNETILRDFIYQCLILTIYSNIYMLLFCIHSLIKKKRKKLYFDLMKKKMFYIFISINNIFYTYFPFAELGIPTAYFIFEFLFITHNMFLTIDILKTHKKIVHKINTKFNNHTILNYDYESDEEDLLQELIYEEPSKLDEHVIIELNNSA